MQPRRYQTRRNQRRRLKLRAVVVMSGLVLVVAGLYAVDASRTAGARKAADTNTPAARNASRTADLNDLAAGLAAYIRTHQALATALPAVPTEICVAASAVCKTTALYDASFLVTTDTGLGAIPTDPIGGPGQYGSGYFIARGTDGKIVLTAPRTENGSAIIVTR